MDMYIWSILGAALIATLLCAIFANLHFAIIEKRIKLAWSDDLYRTPGFFIGDIQQGFTFWKALMWIMGIVAVCLWLWFIGSVAYGIYLLEHDLDVLRKL